MARSSSASRTRASNVCQEVYAGKNGSLFLFDSYLDDAVGESQRISCRCLDGDVWFAHDFSAAMPLRQQHAARSHDCSQCAVCEAKTTFHIETACHCGDIDDDATAVTSLRANRTSPSGRRHGREAALETAPAFPAFPPSLAGTRERNPSDQRQSRGSNPRETSSLKTAPAFPVFPPSMAVRKPLLRF